jgi:hypothetical protein
MKLFLNNNKNREECRWKREKKEEQILHTWKGKKKTLTWFFNMCLLFS